MRRLYDNAVRLAPQQSLYYWKSREGFEDFAISEGLKTKEIIQVLTVWKIKKPDREKFGD